MDNELLIAFEGILERKLDEKLGMIDARMDRFEDRMDRFEERMDRFEDQMGNLSTDVQKLNEQVSSMDVRLRCVELTIENDIRPSIMRIAEGHLDLNRKLDKALESDKEREVLNLRVNYLDAEVRKMKELQAVSV